MILLRRNRYKNVRRRSLFGLHNIDTRTQYYIIAVRIIILLLSVLGISVRLVDETLQVHVAALELWVFQECTQLLFQLGECGSLGRVGRPTLGDHPEQFGSTMRRLVQPVAFAHASHYFAGAHRAVRG